MKFANYRTILTVLILLMAFAWNGAPSSGTTTYQFVGTCSPTGGSNCTGQATATLVLTNYSPPGALSYSNFVSFTYNSNVFGTLSFNTSASLTGHFTNLPGFDQIEIFPTSGNPGDLVFDSGTDGSWGLGAGDQGTGGTWSIPSASPTTPAPSTLLLLALSLQAVAAFQGRARIAALLRGRRSGKL